MKGRRISTLRLVPLASLRQTLGTNSDGLPTFSCCRLASDSFLQEDRHQEKVLQCARFFPLLTVSNKLINTQKNTVRNSIDDNLPHLPILVTCMYINSTLHFTYVSILIAHLRRLSLGITVISFGESILEHCKTRRENERMK